MAVRWDTNTGRIAVFWDTDYDVLHSRDVVGVGDNGESLIAGDEPPHHYRGVQFADCTVEDQDGVLHRDNYEFRVAAKKKIAADTADGPRSRILKQVENGQAVRMSVLYHLLVGRG